MSKSYYSDLIGLVILVSLISSCGSLPHHSRDGAPVNVPIDLSKIPDAVPKKEPLSNYGNPDYYYVNGKRYHTLQSSEGYVARGMASWYGTKFHGRLTSTREPYDMFSMTAAHKTLPLPSYAEVTNLDNGRKVIVRINDRGPFHGNRIIDLSYAAATKLGFANKGTARVEVRAINFKKPEPQREREKLDEPYIIQAGSFVDRANAVRLREQLTNASIASYIAPKVIDPTRVLFRVHIGPLVDEQETNLLTEKLNKLGIEKPRIYKLTGSIN